MIRPIKTVRNRPNTTDNSSQEQKRKMQIKAKTVLRVKSNGFCKRHMQKPLMTKCKEHVCESLPAACITHSLETTPWSEQHTFVVALVVIFELGYPTGLFSNLRTACSETLMLRERKASMADRSLSSLTGELLLLLATAAVAFTTFAARRLSGDG